MIERLNSPEGQLEANRLTTLNNLGAALRTPEESKTQELLKTRFKQATVQEMSKMFSDLFTQTKQVNPGATFYETCQHMVEALPGRVASEAQQAAAQALASIDVNTKELGQQAFFLLNMKSLISATKTFETSKESREEMEEIFMTATKGGLEKIQKLKTNSQMAAQIYMAASHAIEGYISQRDGAPPILTENPNYRQIAESIYDALGILGYPLKQDDLNSLVEDLSQKFAVPTDALEQYILYQASLVRLNEDPVDPETDIAGEKRVSQEVIQHEERDLLDEALGHLTAQRRQALWLKYGLTDGIYRTLQEVADEIERSSENVRQLVAAGILDLQRTSTMSKLLEYEPIDPGFEIPLSCPPDAPKRRKIESGNPTTAEQSVPYDYSIENEIVSLNFYQGEGENPGKVEFFNEAGITYLGDFFNIEPDVLVARWPGNKNGFKSCLDSLNWHIRQVCLDSTSLDPKYGEGLLLHIADSILQRDPNFMYKAGLRLKEVEALRSSINRREHRLGETSDKSELYLQRMGAKRMLDIALKELMQKAS